jgi:hypothetical protein
MVALYSMDKNMFRIAFLIFVPLILLSACTSTTKRTTLDKTGSYGIQFSLDYRPKLCHEHTGFTVFNNFAKEYDLSMKFEEQIKIGYKKGVEATGNNAVILAQPINLESHIETSFWDGVPTLSKQGKQIIIDEGRKRNIDFLLHPSSYTSKPAKFEEYCWGIRLKTGNNNNVPLVPLYSVWVFDTRNGEYAGATFIKNDSFPVAIPSSLETISEVEIKYYESIASKYAQEGIRRFITGG